MTASRPSTSYPPAIKRSNTPSTGDKTTEGSICRKLGKRVRQSHYQTRRLPIDSVPRWLSNPGRDGWRKSSADCQVYAGPYPPICNVHDQHMCNQRSHEWRLLNLELGPRGRIPDQPRRRPDSRAPYSLVLIFSLSIILPPQDPCIFTPWRESHTTCLFNDILTRTHRTSFSPNPRLPHHLHVHSPSRLAFARQLRPPRRQPAGRRPLRPRQETLAHVADRGPDALARHAPAQGEGGHDAKGQEDTVVVGPGPPATRSGDVAAGEPEGGCDGGGC